MTKPVVGSPGGAQATLTTSAVAVDLSTFKGRSVLLWADADIWFSFASVDTDLTLVTSGASAASTTSLKADRLQSGVKIPRMVTNPYPYLIVKTVTGTGTLHVKMLDGVDGCDISTEQAAAPSLGTVTIGDFVDAQLPTALGQTTKAGSLSVTLASNQDALPVTDNSGSLTVDSGQLPSALGAQTAATSLSVVAATPAQTSNATYLVNQSMAADIDGGAITIGVRGELEISAKWTASSTQIGVLYLQTLSSIDGTTYVTIPGSSGGFTSHPNNDTLEVKGYFYGLRPGSSVRLKYLRTSGGAAGNNFSAGYVTL